MTPLSLPDLVRAAVRAREDARHARGLPSLGARAEVARICGVTVGRLRELELGQGDCRSMVRVRLEGIVNGPAGAGRTPQSAEPPAPQSPGPGDDASTP